MKKTSFFFSINTHYGFNNWSLCKVNEFKHCYLSYAWFRNLGNLSIYIFPILKCTILTWGIFTHKRISISIFLWGTSVKKHRYISNQKRDQTWQVQTYLHWEIGKLDATYSCEFVSLIAIIASFLVSCLCYPYKGFMPQQQTCSTNQHIHRNGVNELVKHVHGILMDWFPTR